MMTATAVSERRNAGYGGREAGRIENAENLTAYLTARSRQIAQACGGKLDPVKVIKLCGRLIDAPKNRLILRCTLESFYQALCECLTLGLMPLMGRGYFVPEGDRVLFLLGYQGMIELATKSGIFVKAFNVFKGDRFKWAAGANERILHYPNIEVPRTRENFLCSYCVSKFDGLITFDVMLKEEIDRIREKSGYICLAWDTDYLEMARKTVVRRASKFWPLRLEARAVCELEEREGELEHAEKSV